jgi:hypothetical protein
MYWNYNINSADRIRSLYGMPNCCLSASTNIDDGKREPERSSRRSGQRQCIGRFTYMGRNSQLHVNDVVFL